jgi:hypothetical protein
MQRRRNSGNSPSFLQEEELSSLRIGFVYKTLSCYARRYIAFTVFSRIEEKVKSHWIVIRSVKRVLSQIEVPKLQKALGTTLTFFILLSLMLKPKIKIIGIDSVAITYACEPPQKYAIRDPYPCNLPPIF